MKQLSATATGTVDAPTERCYRHLLEIERYPDWYPDGAKRVSVRDRDADGVAMHVDAVLAAAAGPLRKRFDMRFVVERTPFTRVALARVADTRGDHESLTITWLLRELPPAPDSAGGQTELTIELQASLNAPRFLPLDGVGHEIAHGFLSAAQHAI